MDTKHPGLAEIIPHDGSHEVVRHPFDSQLLIGGQQLPVTQWVH